VDRSFLCRVDPPPLFPSATNFSANPLQEHGLIGNNRTAALVHASGSVEWASFPDFDSPPIFSHLLDPSGGYFRVGPTPGRPVGRIGYVPGTNILETRFELPGGAEVTLTDFCPEVGSDRIFMSEIHRRVIGRHRRVEVALEFAPRFGYGRVVPELQLHDDGVLASSPQGSASVSWARGLSPTAADGVARATFSLEPGEERWFVVGSGSEVVTPLKAYEAPRRLERTRRYWQAWGERSTYGGRWQEEVRRSALLLKLLFYRPTGAMVAAPTTSLPECPGGPRNWDYRYCWVRDSALAVRSLFHLGYTEEAASFVYWLLDLLDRDATSLRVLYTVHGGSPEPERELPDWAGYAGSGPVRVGNAACDHVQHDVLGYVLEVADLLHAQGGAITVDLWRQLRRMVNQACRVWREPDRGIWEVRSEPRHYVYSKAMCWFALDRGIALGERLGFVAPYDEWRQGRAAIREEVLSRGRLPDGQGLAWYYGASGPDASLLRLPFLGFLRADEPVMTATLARIETELREGPFVARYRLPDGLPPGEGFFLPCSYWLAQLYVQMGRREEAIEIIEELRRRTPPLGLLSEEMDPRGNFLGNYPQAFSHLALILAATSMEGLPAGRGSASGSGPS
jgi:alpha,alpha-trehalase